jgi:putative transposase
VTQVRQGDFYSSALERGTRCEHALKLALAEMYEQSISIRKIKAIVEQLGGLAITKRKYCRLWQS